MAYKPDIRYIQFYTDGSAARQLQPAPQKKHKYALPKAPRQEQRIVCVDPLALGGIVVSVIMLVLMLLGAVELFTLRSQTHQMESYVSYLTQENARLEAEYEAGYDLEDIEAIAHSMGLVPAEQNTITVSMPPRDSAVLQPTLWEKMSAFFRGLFA